MDGPLVGKVNVLANGQALGVLVRQDDGSRRLGLTHNVYGPRVVQEAVVNATGVPGIDTHGAAE